MKSSPKIKVVIRGKNSKTNTLFSDSVNTENKYPSSSDKTLIEKELNEESVDDLGLLHELVSEFVGERYDENEKQCKNTNKQLYLDYGNEKDDNDSQVPVDNKHINKNNKPPGKAYKYYQKDQLLTCGKYR